MGGHVVEPVYTRVGVGVIVCRAGAVLLGRRRGSHGAGTWALPGGGLEFGESVQSCAQRELLEETALRTDAFRQAPYTVDHFPGEQKHYVTLFVEALDVTGEVLNCEPEKCDGWQWFAWNALPAPLFPPLLSLRSLGFVPEGLSSGPAA
jgi:8-oxo-dGTP diphosphatase